MFYETILTVALNSGLIYFLALVGAVLVYVLWPGNREKFQRAARLPLENEEI